MASIIWSPSALKDIDSIAEYIARDSIGRSSHFVRRILETTKYLKKLPYSGRIIPEIGDEHCREILVGSYRIMYRIEKNDIWITGVIHGARDWNPDE